jgi:2-polyprenyl-3-methyl-5-hydroxy-6-metoxy-1,4-benzoquinol methylase
MKFKYLYSFFKTFKIKGLFSVFSDFKGIVRYHFLYAAVESGLLEALRTPCSRNDLLEKLEVKNPDILNALLKVGISLKELSCKKDSYGIRGKRSLAMVDTYGDTLSAIIQANVTYYNNSYRHAAARMKGAALGDDLKWAGDIIARFSKLSDPVIKTFLLDIVPPDTGLRVLDIGCGSGLLLKSISQINPDLSGLGIEVDEAASRQAIENMEKWKLQERFEIVKGDIRDLSDDIPHFDLITLVNVVYYFPVEQRTELFRSLRSRLSPRGSLVIIMNMQGKDSDFAAANLNMANASIQGVTLLPDPVRLREQLRESGFSTVRVSDLMPGSSFVGMQAKSE